mmetsp:Transcript_31137/g.34976  ORF Transcript_31137/g.34976 Transcript_31137/m.34976 type:complete len:215 (+) Transcript_31137:73-717(+)
MASSSLSSSLRFVTVPVLFSVVALLSLLSLAAAGTNEAGLAYLKANKNKPDVITLASGLQYKSLNKGDGKVHPTINSPCSCHYEGKLTDGTVFDSSYARGSPTTFAPNQVIKGWTEAMQLMVVGDKWEMYIPSELGYGDRGSPPKIPGGDVLVFVMEILEIKGDSVPVGSEDDDDDDDDDDDKYVGEDDDDDDDDDDDEYEEDEDDEDDEAEEL